MRTFSISTLGCKVNQYEAQQIREFLEGLGLSVVEPNARPELVVINTCCVTATASAKSRQYIQRAGKLSPDAIRVVCGCLPAMKSREMTLSGGNNIRVVSSRDELPAVLTQIVVGENTCIRAENSRQINDDTTGLTNFPRLPLLTSFKGHTRAFLKVQDGCDGLCTYCIVPKVRPDVHSKPIDEAIDEAKQLVAAGHKEIVVTGVCLGAYGRQTVRRNWIPDRRAKEAAPDYDIRGQAVEDRQENRRPEDPASPNGYAEASGGQTLLRQGLRRAGDRRQKTEDKEYDEQRTSNVERPTSNKEALSVLLGRLAGVEGLYRIRVSSLEPGDISEELLDVFCKHSNIMPHIHLSVQSGSDNILRRMGRQYSAAELREKIALIKSRLDRPAITSDIIVGFPAETQEDFEQTAELAKWAGFSKMHIFPFSVRMGTPAAKLKGRVAPGVIKERAEILRKLSDELGRKFREQFIGETCEVLLENTEPLSGRCERYFEVEIKSGTTDCADYTDSLATEIFSHRGHRDHRENNENQIVTNLVPSGLSGKNQIVRVKITAATEEGAAGEEAG